MKNRKQAIEPNAASLLEVLSKAKSITKQATQGRDELMALSKAE